MYKSKKSKKTTILASILLILCVSLGGTIAFLVDDDGPIINKFTPSQVTTEVSETNSEITKSDVSIKNTGDVDAWIRATIIVTWKNSNGNIYGGAQPVEGINYAFTLATNSVNGSWFKDANEFYYWTKPVPKGELTGVLIDSCTYIGGAPEGYYLSVEILGSGIQSKPDAAVEQAWPAVEVKDGVLVAKQ